MTGLLASSDRLRWAFKFMLTSALTLMLTLVLKSNVDVEVEVEVQVEVEFDVQLDVQVEVDVEERLVWLNFTADVVSLDLPGIDDHENVQAE